MADKRQRVGLVHVYTGDGKGKTTAALGLALRAAGYGLRTVVIQFIKARTCGEHQACLRLEPDVTIMQMGDGFVLDTANDNQRYHAVQALVMAEEVLSDGQTDVLILDEINCAISCGLIALKDVMRLIQRRPSHMELVLTGRGAPYELCQQADLVTQMNAVKHPYDEGVPARRGIDY